MEKAMEERKHTLEKIEIARDDLTIQLRKLEQNLQEKDIKVEVNSNSKSIRIFLNSSVLKPNQFIERKIFNYLFTGFGC